MKALIYNIDEGGLKSHSEYLSSAMKKLGFDVTASNKIDYKNYDLVHILFDYSLFHHFGLRIIPALIRLKLNGISCYVANQNISSEDYLINLGELRVSY